MALIECSECSNQISDKAASCPKCGAPVQAGTTAVATATITPAASSLNAHGGTETVYYTDNNGVKITNTRFIVGSSTYPLQGITSIKTALIPASMTPAVILIVVGVLICFTGAVPVGGVMAILGLLYIFLVKNKHAVKISTSAAETNALISKDKVYIEKVANALNEAIIHRG